MNPNLMQSLQLVIQLTEEDKGLQSRIDKGDFAAPVKDKEGNMYVVFDHMKPLITDWNEYRSYAIKLYNDMCEPAYNTLFH